MLFSLEAVFAKAGDALILHYGSADRRRWILVDGGPPGVYTSYLRPRLEELRSGLPGAPEAALPLELVVVSHVDEDHIAGILELYDELLSAEDDHAAMPFVVRRLWHNSFDDVVGDTGATQVLTQGTPAEDQTGAVASVAQGRRLRQVSERLATGEVNPGFQGLVVSGGRPGPVDLGDGLALHVLCPTPERVEGYRRAWERALPAILRKERAAAEVAAMEDVSPTNLSSIVFLAELAGRTMLLTGDARGDDVLAGLQVAGLLPADGSPLKVDLLKMPHHGSCRNVDEAFLRRVVADHYVFSADGRDGNPDPATLQMLADARPADDYTLHFTVRSDAARTETDPERGARLVEIMEWLRDRRPAGCRVAFRGTGPDARSVVVELGDGATGQGEAAPPAGRGSEPHPPS